MIEDRDHSGSSKVVGRAYWLGAAAGAVLIVPTAGLFLGEYLLSGFGLLLCAALMIGNRLAANVRFR